MARLLMIPTFRARASQRQGLAILPDEMDPAAPPVDAVERDVVAAAGEDIPAGLGDGDDVGSEVQRRRSGR